MPMYDYQCQSCRAMFEELVRSADEPVICPECGAESAQRQLSAPSILGTGRAQDSAPSPQRGFT